MNDDAERTRNQKSGGRAFVISRIFDAPRERVWAAWTEPERLGKWFGPKGCTIPRCSMDLKPGGVFHYCMRGPDGREMWGKWTFLEVAEPAQLTVIVSFSDALGGITRHPFAPAWPLETLSTMRFESRGPRTEVTVTWSAYNATPAEIEAFDRGHESMKGGWGGTFDQLAEYLAAAT